MKGWIAIAGCVALTFVDTAAQAAQPPRPCITDGEMHGLVAYFLPAVIDEVTSVCTPHLQADSYLRSGMTVLRNSLGAGKEAAWPAARAAFFKMSDAADEKTMASLSDKALRPLVDEILAGKMAIPVDAPKCAEIDGIAEALAPLSPDQTVHLIATIFNTVGRQDKKMRSCPRVAS